MIMTTLISSTLYAANTDYHQISYIIKKGDTFANILRQYVKVNSIINARTPMIKKIREENPHIDKWSELRPGKEITLFVTSKFLKTKKAHLKISK